MFNMISKIVILSSVVLLSCNSDKDKMKTVHQKKNQVVEQHFKFDNDSYFEKRRSIVNRVSLNEDDSLIFNTILDDWISYQYPKTFWNLLQEKYTINSVLLTYEVGSENSQHYWIGVIVNSKDKFYVINSMRPRISDDILTHEITKDSLNSIQNYLEDSLKLSSFISNYNIDMSHVALCLITIKMNNFDKDILINDVSRQLKNRNDSLGSYLHKIFANE